MPRLYSLFEMTRKPNGRKSYRRVSELAFTKEHAIRVFQSALIASAFTSKPFELRPVPAKATEG